MRLCAALTVCSAFLLGISGCFQVAGLEIRKTPPTTETNITVSYNGAPLPNALVTLFPEGEGFPEGEEEGFPEEEGSPEKEEKGTAATGFTDENGIAQMTTFYPNDGVRPGKYVVTVAMLGLPESEEEAEPEEDDYDSYDDEESSAGPAMENILPPDYASKDTTDLAIEIPTDGVAQIEFTLSGDSEEEE